MYSTGSYFFCDNSDEEGEVEPRPIRERRTPRRYGEEIYFVRGASVLEGSSVDGVSWSSGKNEVRAVKFLHPLDYMCTLLEPGVTEH